ncbi:DUF3298 and DUF4163 domain-containing protein [Candidatus Nitrosacidococcus tergens]|uniref:DUF3298 domain-containing protein n=1 Tax=Candidatus Nitrosacidococcus tergens TaxID=553981 RepID=A0A7G1QBQ2_9GAMM|nr:DUF3298 and DUF4163 domain-containing protein [Candidatus Nitrosacidococcus tergens]CAB1277389.1 protein of unknown function [Candidatus Nitrosacidococcus tergens]
MERWLPLILTVIVSTIGIHRASKTCSIYPVSNQSQVLVLPKEPRYAISITYPELVQEERLRDILEKTGQSVKEEFIKNIPDLQYFPDLTKRKFTLFLTFSIISQTEELISIRGSGGADTGGAHPLPIEMSFIYNKQAQRIITFNDLFIDPQTARQQFSKFSRTVLKEKLLNQISSQLSNMQVQQEQYKFITEAINEGTQPIQSNFSEFILLATDASSKINILQLIFPPYQVVPYVYGTQVVEIPLKIFADFINPIYKSMFAVNETKP